MVMGLVSILYLWSLCILGIIGVSLTDKSKMTVLAFLVSTNLACFLVALFKAIKN